MPVTPLKTKTACDQCRFRKLKCDGGFPCARCARMEFECSFNTQSTRNRRVEQLRGRRSPLSSPVTASDEDGEGHDDTRSPESPSFGSGVRDLLPSGPIPQHMRAGLPDSASSFQTRHRSSRQAGQWPEDATLQVPDTRGMAIDLQHANDTAVRDTGRDILSTRVQGWSTNEPQRHLNQVNERPNSVSVPHQDPRSPLDIPTVGPDAFGSSLTTSIDDTRSASFNESEVLPWLDIFFARLSSTLPIVDHTVIYRDVIRGRQETDRNFASMVLSLCALALVQPVFKAESPSMLARTKLARQFLGRALQARGYDWGEDMTIEAVIASFFMFATLYGLDHPKAAWLRLKEAVECGQLIGLHRPDKYNNLSIEERSQPLRLFLILAVTERGYALQRDHCISFTGQHMEKMADIYNTILADPTTQVNTILVHDGRNATAMHGILQLIKLFDSVDEDVIPCWNKSCSPPMSTCTRLTVERAHNVYESISSAMDCDSSIEGTNPRFFNNFTTTMPTSSESATALNEIQWVDCFMLQQWLLVRLWVSCLTHDLITGFGGLEFTGPRFPFYVAEKVLKQCERVHTSVLEVHGLGMIERFHDIALAVVMSIQHCPDPDKDASHALLERYLALLQDLRNGEHPFASALRKAYESTKP